MLEILQKDNNIHLPSRKWLETDFQDLVRCQLAAVVARLSRTAAMSKANGILTILKAWNGTCSPDDIFSLGVHCPGSDTTKNNE